MVTMQSTNIDIYIHFYSPLRWQYISQENENRLKRAIVNFDDNNAVDKTSDRPDGSRR